ncbi:hypothetical protein ACE6H2_022871 [Prunus campanulata]
MMCFHYPANLCKEINGDIAKFWWGNAMDESKIHWKSWHSLCRGKESGGLGFRDLMDFNLALLGKQCWRMLSNPDAYWVRVLKPKYFPNEELMQAKVRARASWAWSSLIARRDVILLHARCQIFNGRKTNIWNDSWIPPPHQGLLIPRTLIPESASRYVSEIMDHGNHRWNLEPIEAWLDNGSLEAIRRIPMGAMEESDRFVWPWSSDGLYYVKLGYHFLHSKEQNGSIMGQSSHLILDLVWKLIWSLKTLPKIKLFCWRILNKALATRLELFKVRCALSPVCPICEQAEESIEHTLFLCP